MSAVVLAATQKTQIGEVRRMQNSAFTVSSKTLKGQVS